MSYYFQPLHNNSNGLRYVDGADNVRVASGRVLHFDAICFKIEFILVKMSTARSPRRFTLQDHPIFSLTSCFCYYLLMWAHVLYAVNTNDSVWSNNNEVNKFSSNQSLHMIVYTFQVQLGSYTQKVTTPMVFTINSSSSSDKIQKLTMGD